MYKERMQSDDVTLYRVPTKTRGRKTSLSPFWYVKAADQVVGLLFLDKPEKVRYFGHVNDYDREYIEEHVSIMLQAEVSGSVPPPPPEGLDSKEEEDYGDF